MCSPKEPRTSEVASVNTRGSDDGLSLEVLGSCQLVSIIAAWVLYVLLRCVIGRGGADPQAGYSVPSLPMRLPVCPSALELTVTLINKFKLVLLQLCSLMAL